MKLGQWLDIKQITQETFAEWIGVAPGSVSRYVSGERTPKPKTMVRIKKATQCEVTADDFLREVTADDLLPQSKVEANVNAAKPVRAA